MNDFLRAFFPEPWHHAEKGSSGTTDPRDAERAGETCHHFCNAGKHVNVVIPVDMIGSDAQLQEMVELGRKLLLNRAEIEVAVKRFLPYCFLVPEFPGLV